VSSTTIEPTFELHRRAALTAWADYDGTGSASAGVVLVEELSANVSTNQVYRLTTADGRRVFAKVSSYGSYFLFAEDHDRLARLASLLRPGRFGGVLADVLTKNGRAYTWYDGSMWAAFYEEVERRDALPRILTDDQVDCFGREIAEFHLACADHAALIPASTYSLKSDAIHLLDLLASPFAPRNFDLPPEYIGVLWRHTHQFLMRLLEVGYDDWPKLPVLIDWNLGNFSVDTMTDGQFRLFSRWDYDWFRVEPRLMDFYFLSRVSSRTGDRTQFTYSSHTLLEPRFVRFLTAYHGVYPLTEAEIRFLPEVYRFFILNYVVREGARFFRPDLCTRFRRDAARTYLPELERLDITPLLRILD
jgi:Ser/Thr protein kinase RdoA (MazF antagonist)